MSIKKKGPLKRGDIVYIEESLKETEREVVRKTRPYLIIQLGKNSNFFLGAALSTKGSPYYPFVQKVDLSRFCHGFKVSYIEFNNLQTIKLSRVLSYIGTLDKEEMIVAERKLSYCTGQDRFNLLNIKSIDVTNQSSEYLYGEVNFHIGKSYSFRLPIDSVDIVNEPIGNFSLNTIKRIMEAAI